MTAQQCSCGFTQTASTDETISDYLAEVFTPEDGLAADRRVHLEGPASQIPPTGAPDAIARVA